MHRLVWRRTRSRARPGSPDSSVLATIQPYRTGSIEHCRVALSGIGHANGLGHRTLPPSARSSYVGIRNSDRYGNFEFVIFFVVVQRPRARREFDLGCRAFEHNETMPPKMRGMPSRPPSPFEQPSNATAASFRDGEQVCIVGLRSQAVHNGRTGFLGFYDVESERFECHVSPLRLDVGASGGMKMNWVDWKDEGKGFVLKVKPANLQGINLSSTGPEDDFHGLGAAQKVAVQKAQKILWDESTVFKDGKRRQVNVRKLDSRKLDSSPRPRFPRRARY